MGRKTEPARIASWIISRNEVEFPQYLREYKENPNPETWKEVIDHIEWMIFEDWGPICELSCFAMDPANIEEIRDRIADWIEEVAREIGLPDEDIYKIRNEFVERFNRFSSV